MTNIQLAREENMALKEAIGQEGQRKYIEQRKVDQMETQIDAIFQAISDETVLEETSSEENITNIVWNLQQYKEWIKELKERAAPTTPLVV
jgi:hypothetical protein